MNYLTIQLDKKEYGHKDLWVVCSLFDFSYCYDTYYFLISNNHKDKIDDDISFRKLRLTQYLQNWINILKKADFKFAYLPIGLWDECTVFFKLEAKEIDEFEVSFGWSSLGGYSIDLSNPGFEKEIGGFKTTHGPKSINKLKLIKDLEESLR